MQGLKRVIREVHRRSLWQVLAIYLVGSWVVLQVVDVVSGNMGLPPWTFAMAVVLLLIGLPIVLATAFVQEGIGRNDDDDAARHAPASQSAAPAPAKQVLNWRNAVVGGVVAFLLLGVAAAGWMALGGRGSETEATAASHASSIAVLPFSSVQTDEESQAFVAGIHDDLLTQLSKIDSLTVISRTSVMKYKQQSGKSIPEIARELGVKTVLEGGIQRSGQRVRVNVQLIEAATDKHLWAETYDQELTAANIFEIQSDLARKIAGALQTKLTPAVQAQLEQRPTESLEAYDLVARGRYIMNERGTTRDGLEAAAKLYRDAIVADSSYAPAYVGLADTYRLLFNNGYLTEHVALPQARANIEKALALDPNLAEAHALLGTLLRFAGKLEDAERSLRRALELNPGLSATHRQYSALLLDLNRVDEAVQEARRSVELDPLSSPARRNLVSRLVWARRFDEGIAEANKVLELNPDEADAHYYVAIAWSFKGEHARAIEAYSKAMQMNPEDPYYPAGLAWAYARAGRRAEALEALKQAEKMKVPTKESALVYAALGDLDRAFSYLERAYKTEPITLNTLKSDPSSDPLKSDPRWAALMRKLETQ